MDRIYYETANIIAAVLAKKSTIRKGVYDSHIPQKGKLMKLCCETLKYRNYLEKFIEEKRVSTVLKTDGIKGNRELALVVLYEMLFGKGIQVFNGKIKASAKLIENAVRIQKATLEKTGITPDSCAEVSVSAQIPRYVRVNTLVTTLEDIIKHLQKEGWNIQPTLSPMITSEEFKEAFSKLDSKSVMIDPHVDNLLIFPTNTDFHKHSLVSKGALLLQDKASCFTACVLNPKPGSHAFDACAAPGNKTSHMAAIMRNKGKIFACDLSGQRIETLREMLKKSSVEIANVTQGDFLSIDKDDPAFAKVKYIIVDPPCSGSGIAKRADFMSDERKNVNKERLDKLHNLQVMLLRHALSFPAVHRVAYSTCSIHAEENEDVIAEMIGTPEIDEKFRLIDPLSCWTSRGLEQYHFGSKVIRAEPEKDLTNGFFVALFQKKKKEK
jgi:putative methyltransferase